MSSGSRVVPRGRADRRTDMTKLIVALRNFAKAPNEHSYSHNFNFCIGHVSLVFAEAVGVLLLMISAILNCL